MDSKQQRISVVIAAFNASRTIVASVNSVLNQTYPAFELLIINDGSTDDTDKVIREKLSSDWKDHSITYFVLPENSGPSAARNAGWDRASGDLIAFQDADDIWHERKLELIVQAMNANEKIRFLFHPYTLRSMNETVIADVAATTYPVAKLLWSNPIGVPCVVMVNDPELRFDVSMRYMEDYDLWLRASGQYGVWYLPIDLTQLGRPVLSAGGQSSNRKAMRSGELRAYFNLCRRRPAYYLLLPFLAGFSILKHVVKSLRG